MKMFGFKPGAFACVVSLIFGLALSTVPFCAFAEQADDDLLASMMSVRGMGDLMSSELLLDRHGDYTYAIGYSEDGYLISERTTGAFMEQGGGAEPYSSDAEEKYYGGLLCYAEKINGQLVDPCSGKTLVGVPYCPQAEDMVAEVARTEIADDLSSNENNSNATQTEMLSQARKKIQGVAFGNNSGDYSDTCTAVAASIALNYLDYTFDSRLVDSNMELAPRKFLGESATEFENANFDNANRFHHYLVDECGMTPQSLAFMGNIGLWGPWAKGCVDDYLQKKNERNSVGLGFDWDLLNQTWIRNSIAQDVPIIISIWHAEWEGHAYDTHSMVAYGFRVLSDGSLEVCLHSGWYDNDCLKNGDVFYKNEKWGPASIVTVTHRFTLSDGWHFSGKGDWKYYLGGRFVTGWRIIDGDKYYFNNDGVRITGYYTENGIRYYFNSYGVLVSQAPVSSPLTGSDDDSSLDKAQIEAQLHLQATRPYGIPAALESSMRANPDVFAWLYVPGTDVSVPVARREGDGSFYLSHGPLGDESPIGCAHTRQGAVDLSDAVTVLYGHSFSAGSLAFTSLHAFEEHSFFAAHERVYVYLPGRRLEYRIVGANLFTDRAIEALDQSDSDALASYFAALSDPDPAGFAGSKRPSSLDPASDRVLQLSTCTVPADPRLRFVVTCAYVGEREL